MRSDFYDLPWAAQQAIRRGERASRSANSRANTIEELEAAIAAQSDTITRLQAALTTIANAQRIGADSDILAWKSLAHACQSEAVKALHSSVGGE